MSSSPPRWTTRHWTGVELSLYNIAQEMILGAYSQIVAPKARHFSLPLVHIAGNLQTIAQSQERTAPIIMPEFPVGKYVGLHSSGELTDDCQLAYDWLPFYLTPFSLLPLPISSAWVHSMPQWIRLLNKWGSVSGTIGFIPHRRQRLLLTSSVHV